jgi:hypothetical protein
MKRSKFADRQKMPGLKAGRRLTLRLLDTIDDATVFFYGTYRYRRVATSQGLEGLRRVMREEKRCELSERLRYLRRRGLIREKERRDVTELSLTTRGRNLLLRLRVRAAPKRPDAKRLMVAFDIPETHRDARAALRQLLSSSGFKRLQDSVWLSDRDASGALSEWADAEGLRDWVRTFVVEEI